MTPDERNWLKSAACEVVEEFVRRGEYLLREPSAADLREPRSFFVTLRVSGLLRGCLGLVRPERPLFQGVQEMAVAAATRDDRFEPIRLFEIGGLSVDISVLSPFLRIRGERDIEVGRHGLFLRGPSRSGLLLPQVATEHGFDARAFLAATFAKAGLSTSERERTEIFAFTAEVF